METKKQTNRHQVLEALRILSMVVQCAERKFAFSSEDGQEMLKEAKKAYMLLEKEIDVMYPKN